MLFIVYNTGCFLFIISFYCLFQGIAGLQPNINPGKSEALQQQAAAAAFNGLGRCAGNSCKI